MKKLNILSAIVATIAMFMSGQAFAQYDPLLAVNNMISGSYISTNVNYAETNPSTGGLFDTEKGNVPGFDVSLDMMGPILTSKDYFHISYSQTRGHTNYVGGPINGSLPYGSYVGISTATITDFDLRYGVGFESGHSLMITPYIDLGKHAWFRGVNYGEKYYNWYTGIGLLAQGAIANFAVLSVDAMYGSTLYPRISVAATPPYTFSTVVLRQGQSPMYRIGAKLNINLSHDFYANAGVNYTHFKYGISPVDSVYHTILEPSSTTKYITYSLGLGYSFK